MSGKGGKIRVEVIEAIFEICDKIDNDPEVREEAEEYQRRYGTLTEEELKRIITI